MRNGKVCEEDGVIRRPRFLRDSLRGSMPLLLGLNGDAAPERTEDPVPPAGKTSPPPAAPESPPVPIKEHVDRRQEEFARDNPGMTKYPDG